MVKILLIHDGEHATVVGHFHAHDGAAERILRSDNSRFNQVGSQMNVVSRLSERGSGSAGGCGGSGPPLGRWAATWAPMVRRKYEPLVRAPEEGPAVSFLSVQDARSDGPVARLRRIDHPVIEGAAWSLKIEPWFLNKNLRYTSGDLQVVG